jgi:TonB family protein
MQREAAVEVISLFEDAVQEVRYLRTEPPRAATPWFIGGGVGLFVMGIAFVVAICGVASLWLDALAAVGAAAGVAGIAIGFARRRPHTPSLSLPRGAKITSAGGDFFVDVGRADGELATADGTRPLVPGEHLTLQAGMQLRLIDGPQSALVSLVEAPAESPLQPVFDWRAQVSTAGAAMVAGVVALIASAAPPESNGLAIDRDVMTIRLPTFTNKPPQEEPEKEASAEAGAKGKRAQGESGKVGKKNADKAKGVIAHAPTTTTNRMTLPSDMRMRATDIARNTGVLSLLGRGEPSQLGAVFRPESALGIEASRAMEGLQGTELSDGQGANGLDVSGTGIGGGGDGKEATVAGGPLGVVGRNGPGGSGGNYGKCRGENCGLGRKHNATIETPSGDVTVTATRDKSDVRRVIRSHMNEVKFCYERELAKQADLNGRLVVKFVIDANGGVSSSIVSQSSLNNAEVDKCVAGAVNRWNFGLAKGVAIVSYPFVFHRVGAN